jgi:UDP-N-acetylmuramate dehydrogenase
MNKLRGQMFEQALLSNYTSLHVGGPCKQLFIPADLEDLKNFLQVNHTPLRWLGLGSNTLIRDGGLDATVIVTKGLKNITQLSHDLVRAEAGVPCPVFARFCARHHLEDAEFFIGIPGTIGGALTMNAGCLGGETWKLISQVETIDSQGVIRIRSPKDFEIQYRQVKGPVNEYFIAGHFHLRPGTQENASAKIRTALQHRINTQPLEAPSCGSVFRNPPNQHAAKLIESCGLKGTRIGDASISTKHANFILNHGHATAADIEALMQRIQTTVWQQHQVQLIPEVHILGKK